jgi:Ca2+/Na+ antiporter
MGANPTQAYAVMAFLVAFVLIAAGFALGGNILLIVIGLGMLALSIMIFMKCKPWEYRDQ